MTPATIANAIERARKADRSGFYGNTVVDLIAAAEWLLRENARLVLVHQSAHRSGDRQ